MRGLTDPRNTHCYGCSRESWIVDAPSSDDSA